MTTGLMNRPAHVGHPLDMALPGGSSSRGFWTKRKKTAMSLLAVMALIAGVALAFKVFDQIVPNNVVRDAANFNFTIKAKDVTAGEGAFRDATGADVNSGVFRQDMVICPAVGDCNVNTFPGDSRRSDVLIKNTNATPAKDASFQVYVDPLSIVVFNYDPVTDTYAVEPAGAPRTRFLSFWTLKVEKQTYWDTLPVGCPNGDCSENNANSSSSYSTTCEGALTTINKNAPCKLGIIRALGSTAGVAGLLLISPSDDRQYRFNMAEADDGTDQSLFKGWRIIFTLVFQARVPAEAESGRYSLLPNP